MKINYSQILKKNMLNVLKEILIKIEENGLQNGHHLYITFKTNQKNVIIADWLKKKFPYEMTIIIQYEYWNLKVAKEKFEILLSFNGSKTKLSIPFNAISSFADPYANFGLKINNESKNIKKKNININKVKNSKKKNNVIDFLKYK